MSDAVRPTVWFVDNWSRLSLPAAVLILALLPLFWTDDARSLVLVATLLPFYMIHQYEEHAHGRFVAFFNATIGHGRETLTKTSACLINVGEVWLLFIACFYLAKHVSLGLALIPVYLTLLNGLTHLGATLALRRENPGLVTGLVLFLPWADFLLVYVTARASAPVAFNLLGFAAGVLGHAAIVVYALRRRRRLAAHA